ncbi:MAG TPA: DNA polymerase domain-containing protein [Candidatus Sumerlaeota bacterium]|nr:DNA polymerase domain-containing protein [Candidatus Sumerlaeota bacterium]
MPVPNRYFGLFEDGTLKYRGIEVRRSDQAPYVQRVQRELLDALAAAPSLAACRALRGRLYRIVQEAERRLRERAVDLEDLIFKRKTSMEADDYRGNGMTALAARQMKQAGLTLHAGEVVRYLVLSEGDRDLNARIRVPSLLGPDDAFDVEFYVNQLRRAAATLLEPILAEPLPPL